MDKIVETSEPQGSKGGKARAAKLTKEQRSAIAKTAAAKRWKKPEPEPIPEPPPVKKRVKAYTGPREFSVALKTAEKRLAKAILERAEYSAKWATVNAEIPTLQSIILALRGDPNSLGALMRMPQSLEQIVGDTGMAPPTPRQHPAVESRAAGGAVGVQLEDGEEEDTFLRDSAVGGGNWHG